MSPSRAHGRALAMCPSVDDGEGSEQQGEPILRIASALGRRASPRMWSQRARRRRPINQAR